jgi:DNA-binding CsgD family transcriptional regulator/sugar-specific transcriptional regulator TrmB
MMFEVLGFTEMTESVYFALLAAPHADLQEIRTALGVTEEEMRVALDDLARMSLVLNSSRTAAAVRPVNPQAGLAALVARRQREIDESKAAFEVMLTAHAPRGGPTGPGVERLDGAGQIRERVRYLAGSCQWEACWFAPGGAQSAESIATSRELDADAIDRGVRLRTIYLDSVRNDPATLAYAQWLGEQGGEVRTTPSLPLRMLVVDRTTAVVPVDVDDPSASAMVLSGGSVVAALVALFQSAWRAASPLGMARRRDEQGLSAQERRVLHFLAAGLTDEAIARQLGVSVRTSRRVASDLLARLNARSRFQAGVRAAANNWLTAADLD